MTTFIDDIDELYQEWVVSIAGDAHRVDAISAPSAIRSALIIYLDVAEWDQDQQSLWATLDLGDILDLLPDGLSEQIWVSDPEYDSLVDPRELN